ncbi:prolyl-tRNA synthetase [Sporolactobacillus inulinus]|uniref:Prolyl-tRNA synthetase n=1 Tax=Sporolactobacillus inulinus TaxID=2078 RepID=A0A4Y1Z6H4_9BACL|nr:prolyl-tRNA synthetase [Sporolactobacillus inulinus]
MDGKAKPLIMGCYGIGISRTLSAVCEQYHDDEGMVWPKALAPFTIHLITVNPKKMISWRYRSNSTINLFKKAMMYFGMIEKNGQALNSPKVN